MFLISSDKQKYAGSIKRVHIVFAAIIQKIAIDSIQMKIRAVSVCTQRDGND